MDLIRRMDTVFATPTGQTIGWVLIFAIVLGFFTQADAEVSLIATVIALALSWMLGASFGRRQATNEFDRDDRDDQPEQNDDDRET